MSEILKAWSDGKTIEYKCDKGWITVPDICIFNAPLLNYRIKPESKLRPYKNADEFLKAQKEHGLFLIINNKSVIPVSVTDNSILYISISCDSLVQRFTMRELMDYITWQDGTPCGIIEEQV